MLSSAKYLGLGLFIGMAATALIAVAVFFSTSSVNGAAIAPDPSPLPINPAPGSVTPAAPVLPSATPSFTPVPTLIVLATATPVAPPTATSTLDAVQSMLGSGGMVFAGPLSAQQQIAIYKASLNYVETTPADSRRLAIAINGVGYGDPSNICGPLAIAILRDAGLVPPQITPHDFWLLNPLAATDAQLLREAFPSAQSDYSKTITPINKIDWHAAPLFPGDFLFIWHGSGGNFDHMLVVTRIDKAGRAYAVTNFGTPAGFIIGEALLYDPNDPTLGLFHIWTQERDAILGSTGFGGFELWRHKGAR